MTNFHNLLLLFIVLASSIFLDPFHFFFIYQNA